MRNATALIHREISGSIIGSLFEVYHHLGYGLLESVYIAALVNELAARGHTVEREVMVDVFYKGKTIARQRIDLIVDGAIIVEVKATEVLSRFAFRQILSYLTATKLELGLLLRFGPRPRFFRVVSTNRHKTRA